MNRCKKCNKPLAPGFDGDYYHGICMEPDRRVEQPEIDEILAAKPIYNGMISIELRKRYGERLYHVSGDGWYVKATGYTS